MSWHALRGPPGIDVIHGADIAEIPTPPPDDFLRFLADLHRTSGSPVTYYACQTWGGQVEIEYAWVFADEERVYVHGIGEGTFEIGPSGRRACDEEVLTLALSPHGVHLPSPWFAPHARGFGWAPYAAG